MKKNLSKQEVELSPHTYAEVINYNSNYFGEVITITHTAMALGEVWYKGKLGYQIGEFDDVWVWFKENEIELESEEKVLFNTSPY